MKWGGFIKGFAGLLLATALLPGCSDVSSRGTDSAADSAAPVVNSATKTGTVKLSVAFPRTGGAQRAIIDERTASIYVMVEGPTYEWFVLTPDPVTGLATQFVELPVGEYFIMASANDVDDLPLETISAFGTIVEGENRVTLSFMTGDWYFVDDNNAAVPLVVTNAAGQAITLPGFTLDAHDSYNNDPGEQLYGQQYVTTDQVGIFSALGPVVRSSTRNLFDGGSGGTNFGGEHLNIDAPERSKRLVNDGLFDEDPLPGERMLFPLENALQFRPAENMAIYNTDTLEDLLPTVQTLADTRLIDGRTMVGHLLEMTFIEATVDPTPVLTGVDCNMWEMGGGAGPTGAAIRKAAIGDLVPLTGAVTVERDSCDWTTGSVYRVTERYADVATREFRAKAAQRGTVFGEFGPPAPPVP